jgi:hypothetical protein
MFGATALRYPIDPASEPAPMRSFTDNRGGHWQAALMEASFGNALVIFSQIGAAGVLYKPLDTANVSAAGQLLADADEATLRGLLAEATPWN